MGYAVSLAVVPSKLTSKSFLSRHNAFFLIKYLFQMPFDFYCLYLFYMSNFRFTRSCKESTKEPHTKTNKNKNKKNDFPPVVTYYIIIMHESDIGTTCV